jgi:hypothetical protein
VAAVVVLAAAAGACGDGDGSAAGPCGPPTREALDSAFLVHVLADDDGIDYLSDPPTSGPHKPGPDLPDVSPEPLPRPVQVGALERGDVLVQHAPDLPDEDRRVLETLAGDGVVVAPNPDLPAPIVATAWLYKQTCRSPDEDALEDFIETRKDKGPGDDG